MVRRVLAPFRTAFALLVVVLATLILGTYVIVLVRIRPESPQVTAIMRIWARLFLAVAGARTEVEGAEHIDPDASYVFTGNHQSNIDIPVMIGRLPVSVRFLAKKELFGVPVLGRAMRSIHMVRTDRSAGPVAHRDINVQVARVVDRKLSLVIYPEGTRSRNAELMPFKKGAFKIAIDNGLPVVPVVITGAEKVWRPAGKLIYGGRVHLVIHEPISTTGMTAADIGELRDRVRRIVEKTYDEIRMP